MHLRWIKLPGFSNAIAAGAQLLAPLPRGYTYHRILIHARDAIGDRTMAQLATDVDFLHLFVKGKTKWHLTGAEQIILPMNYFYQNPTNAAFAADDGCLLMEFSPLYLRAQETAEDLGLGMADMNENDVILRLDHAAAGGITRADIWAEVGPDSAAGVIRCFRRFIRERAATGEENVAIDLRENEALLGCHVTLGATPGVVSVDNGVRLSVNGNPVLEGRTGGMQRILRQSGRLPNAGYIHFDPLARNTYGQAIFGGGRPANEALGIPAQAPVASLTRMIDWSTLPGAYVQYLDTVEPALSDRG